MKWHWLFVGLVAGAVLLGCGEGRTYPEPETEVVAGTPKAALEAVDVAVANLEKALEGSDLEATRDAARAVTRKLGSVASFLSEMDTKAGNEARKAGTTPGPQAMDKLQPALIAADEAFSAVLPPGNDVAKAKELIPQIKSGVDAVRDLVK
ncbi:MAG: hypothetical protein KAX80_10910 [Planctomycetes bacterium]|nr:hypothetical protein [Planctomycetota bacterium]